MVMSRKSSQTDQVAKESHVPEGTKPPDGSIITEELASSAATTSNETSSAEHSTTESSPNSTEHSPTQSGASSRRHSDSQQSEVAEAKAPEVKTEATQPTPPELITTTVVTPLAATLQGSIAKNGQWMVLIGLRAQITTYQAQKLSAEAEAGIHAGLKAMEDFTQKYQTFYENVKEVTDKIPDFEVKLEELQSPKEVTQLYQQIKSSAEALKNSANPDDYARLHPIIKAGVERITEIDLHLQKWRPIVNVFALGLDYQSLYEEVLTEENIFARLLERVKAYFPTPDAIIRLCDEATEIAKATHAQELSPKDQIAHKLQFAVKAQAIANATQVLLFLRYTRRLCIVSYENSEANEQLKNLFQSNPTNCFNPDSPVNRELQIAAIFGALTLKSSDKSQRNILHSLFAAPHLLTQFTREDLIMLVHLWPGDLTDHIEYIFNTPGIADQLTAEDIAKMAYMPITAVAVLQQRPAFNKLLTDHTQLKIAIRFIEYWELKSLTFNDANAVVPPDHKKEATTSQRVIDHIPPEVLFQSAISDESITSRDELLRDLNVKITIQQRYQLLTRCPSATNRFFHRSEAGEKDFALFENELSQEQINELIQSYERQIFPSDENAPKPKISQRLKQLKPKATAESDEIKDEGETDAKNKKPIMAVEVPQRYDARQLSTPLPTTASRPTLCQRLRATNAPQKIMMTSGTSASVWTILLGVASQKAVLGFLLTSAVFFWPVAIALGLSVLTFGIAAKYNHAKNGYWFFDNTPTDTLPPSSITPAHQQ